MNFPEVYSAVYAFAALSVTITIALALTRSFFGPDLFNRVLAVNVAGTKTILLLVIIGFISNTNYFIDIALAYALINFIGIIALKKLIQINKKRESNTSL